MTPQQYISELRRLIARGQDAAALEFSSQHDQAVFPLMSNEEVGLVEGMLEGAAMAVSMEPQEARSEKHPQAGIPHGTC